MRVFREFFEQGIVISCADEKSYFHSSEISVPLKKKDFRSISLVSIFYKIFAMVLAFRMRRLWAPN